MTGPQYPGVLAISCGRGRTTLDVDGWRRAMGCGDPPPEAPARRVMSWHLDPGDPIAAGSLLSRPTSNHSADPSSAEAVGAGSLDPQLPPFAALEVSDDTVTTTTDYLGFRQLFAGGADGWSALSTSARAVHHLRSGALDLDGVAVLARLGWQVGSRTIFDGVRTVRAVTMANGTVEERSRPAEPAGAASAGGRPEVIAADILRQLMCDYLDAHPDAELQLTGGLDSRILLAAIPAARRRGVRAMTLATPGSRDAPIARSIADRYGLEHRTVTLAAIDTLSAKDAYEAAINAARRIDGAADPVALAAVEAVDTGRRSVARFVGLGGEFARGFYYLGPTRLAHVTERRIRRLADWRLFPNESAPRTMFTDEFARYADHIAFTEVRRALLTQTADDWFRGTDEFYLNHRMRRWAGALASGYCLERVAINPMLDRRFVDIARSVPPAGKKGARFLARVLTALDPDLATIPMDGRPAPRVLARPTVAHRAQIAAARAPKLARKIGQRVSGSALPPEGGALMTGKITDHLRANPQLLESLCTHDFLDQRWLAGVASGAVELPVSACAMLVTLLAV